MLRMVVLLYAVMPLLLSGCPADKCYGNNDCIDGYACTKDSECNEVDTLRIENELLPSAIIGEEYQVTFSSTEASNRTHGQ
jgi:hypothetical protein